MKKNSPVFFQQILKLSLLTAILTILAFPRGSSAQTPEQAAAPAPATDEHLFPTPAILEDNIQFWKKIYSEIPLTEGLVHDRDYPMIIYGRVEVGALRGQQRRTAIRKVMDGAEASLAIITTRPPREWTEKEKNIHALFKQYNALEDLSTASERLRFQLGQKDRYKEGLERAAAYMPFIKKILKEYDIPERVAYLPHVESSFNPKAYSRVGAAGIWQFMRSTGKLFMTISYTVDERWDPYLSTVAAAKLLRRNYNVLKSWPLAITAYNHGMGGISRAVHQTGSNELGVIIANYQNRRFRFASKNFYGCFIAASSIAMEAEKYFTDLAYHEPERTIEITLPTYINAHTAARLLGIPGEELQRLNPSLRPIVFHRRLNIPKNFNFRIPAVMTEEEAKRRLALKPGSLPPAKTPEAHYYTVNRGDTLYSIARKYGTSVDLLLAANDTGSGSRIHIGQVLLIPDNNGEFPPLEAPAAAMTSPASPPVKTIPASPTAAAPATPPAPSATPQDEPVMEPDNNPESFDARLYPLETTPSANGRAVSIRVAAEETLGHYAEWLDISSSQIRQLNRLGKKGIRVNQKLLLPIAKSALESFNSKRLEYHMALEEDFYNEYTVTGAAPRIIQKGETPWSICNSEEVPLWLFYKYNRGVNADQLSPGATIQLPSIKSKEKED